MKPNPILSLVKSRKSIVGVVALILCGLVYFFGPGNWEEKSVAMASIAGISASIIRAIGDEDAAEKASKGSTQ